MPEDLTRRAFGQAVAAAAIGVPMHVQSGGGSQPRKAPDLCFLSATELVSLMRRKQVSARDVMAAHLAQIERVNPKVNAIVTLVAERAMADAARADESLARGGAVGVLHGLPVAHKDLVDTAGIRTTQGSPFYRDFVPTRDALLVTRIRAAGAVTVGKTNTPEFGAGSQTFNTIFGATRNPYDLTKTCGGSSGGAAVALACGWCQSPTAATPAGRCETPRLFATWSASGRRRAGFRGSPRPGRRCRCRAQWRGRLVTSLSS
jgi:amidase